MTRTLKLGAPTNDVQDDPLFRRIRQHAEKRLLFSETQSDKERLGQLKEFLHPENEMLRHYHEKGDSGLRVTRARSVLIDVLIQNLHAYAMGIARDALSKPKPMAMIASGGYGRGELSPHSDLDLMFLYPNAAAGKALDILKETMTREILYPLWDLGLKVGHATRAVRETLEESRRDIRTKNALLDARFLCGDGKVAERFFRKFRGFCRKDDPASYLLEILASQHKRRTEKGGTIYLQAPDVKNGVGGLRDFQAILWMAKVKFESEGLDDLVKRDYLSPTEAKSFREAYSFLLRVRNELPFAKNQSTTWMVLAKILINMPYPIFYSKTFYFSAARNHSNWDTVEIEVQIPGNRGASAYIRIINQFWVAINPVHFSLKYSHRTECRHRS